MNFIKEQVARVLDDFQDEALAYREYHHDGWPRRVSIGDATIADLKALADSHTRLLEAAKIGRGVIESDYEGRNGIAGGMTEQYAQVVAAIEEAEAIY